MARYRKKPIVVDAEIYKPGMEDGYKCLDVPGIYCTRDYCILPNRNKSSEGCKYCVPIIKTLEGDHEIKPGDYIITGIKGERYPCKPDIFEETYEHVANSDNYTEPLKLIKNEYLRAENLHAPMVTAHHGIAIIEEEFIELRNEVFKRESLRDMNAMKEEAVQLGAMALRFLIDICKVGA